MFLVFLPFSLSPPSFPAPLSPSLSFSLSVINCYADEAQLSAAASTVRKSCIKQAWWNRTNHRWPLNFNQAICVALILWGGRQETSKCCDIKKTWRKPEAKWTHACFICSIFFLLLHGWIFHLTSIRAPWLSSLSHVTFLSLHNVCFTQLKQTQTALRCKEHCSNLKGELSTIESGWQQLILTN